MSQSTDIWSLLKLLLLSISWKSHYSNRQGSAVLMQQSFMGKWNPLLGSGYRAITAKLWTSWSKTIWTHTAHWKQSSLSCHKCRWAVQILYVLCPVLQMKPNDQISRKRTVPVLAPVNKLLNPYWLQTWGGDIYIFIRLLKKVWRIWFDLILIV